DTAIEAMRLGAHDYLSKPFDVDELKIKVRNALEQRQLRQENVLLKRALGTTHQFANIIGRSEKMLAVFKLIEQIARTDSTVLVTGESGTGKEWVARAIHFYSLRRERTFRRLGGVEELESAMRVIAATNQELTRLVADGKFREDLFYRINVIPIHLPPLRDRREDIPLLAEYFLGKYREQMGKPVSGLSQESMELLEVYEWPGNIRELENVIERAVALEKSSAVLPESLPEHIVRRVP